MDEYNYKILYILITLSLTVFFIDIYTKHTYECIKKSSQKNTIIIVLLIHQFLHIFANFGWLFNNKFILFIYLLTPSIVLIHWFTNDNKCYLTQKVNKICNFNENVPFNDIFLIIGLKKYSIWQNFLHYVYLGITLCIVFYKLLIIYNVI